jgi:hypothetical protein
MCSRSKILPEERVVDVTWFMASEYKKSIEMGGLTATVELVGGLKRNPLARSRCRNQRLFSGIEAVYIGLMMFLVMEGHDLLTDEGFESIVRIRKRRKSLFDEYQAQFLPIYRSLTALDILDCFLRLCARRNMTKPRTF